MVLKKALTPETFLSVPRRSVVVPTQDGTLGLYNVSTHEFGKGTRKEWRAVDLTSGNSHLLTDDDQAHDANWLPGAERTVVWLRSLENGMTAIVVADLVADGAVESSYVAAEFHAPLQALRAIGLDNASVGFAVVCLASDDGGLYNEETEKKPSTARIYDDIRIREWDTYVKPQKYSIFYSALIKGSDGRYTLAGPLQNALVANKDLEAPDSMYYNRGADTDRFDLGPRGIIFVARDPQVGEPEYTTASNVYFVPIDSWIETPKDKPLKIIPEGENALGTATNCRFSPDGTMIAYLNTPYANEADVRLMMAHVGTATFFDLWDTVIGGCWDLVPASFEYAPSGKSLFLTADHCGRTSLFELQLEHNATPNLLTTPRGFRRWISHL